MIQQIKNQSNINISLDNLIECNELARRIEIVFQRNRNEIKHAIDLIWTKDPICWNMV